MAYFRLWIWEVLNRALEHVSGHVRRSRQTIEKAKLEKERKQLVHEKEDYVSVFMLISLGKALGNFSSLFSKQFHAILFCFRIDYILEGYGNK